MRISKVVLEGQIKSLERQINVLTEENLILRRNQKPLPRQWVSIEGDHPMAVQAVQALGWQPNAGKHLWFSRSNRGDVSVERKDGESFSTKTITHVLDKGVKAIQVNKTLVMGLGEPPLTSYPTAEEQE